MSQTTLQRLLRHVHAAVFDKSPQSELALRISHQDGAAWSVADEVLTVAGGSDEPLSLSLAGHTVGEIATALEAAGFDVEPVPSSMAQRSALVLAEGDGNSLNSNGDRVGAFTSLLWVLLSGYAVEAREAQRQVTEALKQMNITLAEGEWVDLWGALYAVPRLPSETDQHFAARIPQEAFRKRVNAHGIEKAIIDTTGWDVRIEEPWRSIFRLDESALSGEHKFYDGDTIGYHLIQPTTMQQVDWDLVDSIIERNRPAGVKVLPPVVRRLSIVDASYERTVHFKGLREHETLLPNLDRPLLDFGFTLSDPDGIILNHEARWRREILHSSHVIVPDEYVAYAANHFRDYRTHYLSATYAGNSWTTPATWASARSTWTDFNAYVQSKHTRES